MQRTTTASTFARLLERYNIDLVLDVGANVGQFGTWLRTHGFKGRIVSFEPVLQTFSKLEARAFDDARWETRRIGLGDYDGTAEINVSEASVFTSIAPIKAMTTGFYSDAVVVAKETVRVCKLDSIFDEVVGRERAIVLKCDTQGFEKRVLMGARRSLERITGLHLEVSYEQLYDDEPTFEELVPYVRELGFDLVSLEPLLHVQTDRILQGDGTFFRRSFPK